MRGSAGRGGRTLQGAPGADAGAAADAGSTGSSVLLRGRGDHFRVRTYSTPTADQLEALGRHEDVMPYRRISASFRAMTKKLRQPRAARRVSTPVTLPRSERSPLPPVWKVSDDAASSTKSSTAAVPEPTDAELLTTRAQPNWFRSVVAHLVVTGHFIGVLPVPAATDTVPSFRWTSPAVVFSVAVTVSVFLRITVYGYVVYRGYMTAFDSLVSTRLGFHVLATLEFALFLRLAGRWRAFVLCFTRLEHRAQGRGGRGQHAAGDAPRLRRQMRAVTAVILCVSIGETLLQVCTVPLPRSLGEYESLAAILEAHFYSVYNHLAMALPYSAASLIFAEFTTTATNFVLNYNDVFLIIVCLVILQRFRLLRARLTKAAPQKQDLWYWRSAREEFNELSELTREVDEFVSGQVLLSCLNNFFSLCIQLQHSLTPSDPDVPLPRRLYFLYSFVFVLARSGAVVFSASSIPEESKALKRVLYSVPSSLYGDEIQRFLAQVTTDDVSLTGMGLFTITRSFILTMLGTIATYEILLVQMYKADKAAAST